MVTVRIGNQRIHGAVILERFENTSFPASLKAPHRAFKQAHAGFEAATRKAEAARDERDAALEAVSKADEALDATVSALADALVGAGLGTRAKPFGSFSKLSPSAIVELAYAKEVAEVEALIAKLSKKKPPASVKKIAATASKEVAGVKAALKKITAPQANYHRSIAARDALLLAWTKALGSLKRHARAAWEDDEAAYDAAFAPADAIQRPKKTRAKRAPKPAPDPTPAAPNA
jgi:hypothetical protein